jgi:ribosome-associated heat shock protein Hsp15
VSASAPAPSAADHARLDAWLDRACLFKTRSEAQRACRAGKILVNGQPAKAHRPLKPGDAVEIVRPSDRRQTIVVRALADRHVAKADARELYDDRTPPPTAEEIEARQLRRLMRVSQPWPDTAPKRRDQRTLRRLRGKG